MNCKFMKIINNIYHIHELFHFLLKSLYLVEIQPKPIEYFPKFSL